LKSFRKHIARSLTLLALIMAGFILAQMHTVIHLAEGIHVSLEHDHDTSLPESEHHDCLNCTLTFAASDLPAFTITPDYSSKEVVKTTKLPVLGDDSSSWLPPRAPPAI